MLASRSVPQIATRFAELLLASADIDPDIGWLLDHREIHIIAQANPDGRRQVELGAGMWRKNHNETACAAGNLSGTWPGIDLNRNSSFLWGSFSSSDACSQTYRGPVPASEPETLAIQNYLASVFDDQRPASDLESPAPAEARGIFISLHSFAEMVLFPWEGLGGQNENNAPNHDALAVLGRRREREGGAEHHRDVDQERDAQAHRCSGRKRTCLFALACEKSICGRRKMHQRLSPEQFRRSLCGLAPPARPASCASISKACFSAEQLFLHAGPDAADELRAASRVLGSAPNLYDVKASGGFQDSHNMVQIASPHQPYEYVPLAVAARTARRSTLSNRSRFLAPGVQPAAPAPSEFANDSIALAFVTTWSNAWQETYHRATEIRRHLQSTDASKELFNKELAYVEERVDADGGLVPHLSARLSRFIG